MSIFNTFAIDANKESNGVPITFDPNKDGTIPTFYVARQSRGNKRFQKAVRQVQKPYTRQIAAKKLSDDVAEVLVKEAFIKGCLIGWSNIKDQDGNEIPFNEQAANELFDKLPDLLDVLMEESTNNANYQAEELENDLKN